MQKNDTSDTTENRRLYQLSATEQPSAELDKEILHLAQRQLDVSGISSEFEQDVQNLGEHKSNDSLGSDSDGGFAANTSKTSHQQADLQHQAASISWVARVRRYRWPISTAASVIFISFVFLTDQAFMLREARITEEQFLSSDTEPAPVHAELLKKSMPQQKGVEQGSRERKQMYKASSAAPHPENNSALQAQRAARVKAAAEMDAQQHDKRVKMLERSPTEHSRSEFTSSAKQAIVQSTEMSPQVKDAVQPRATALPELKQVRRPNEAGASALDSETTTEMLGKSDDIELKTAVESTNKIAVTGPFTAAELQRIRLGIAAEQFGAKQSMKLMLGLIRANELHDADALYVYLQNQFPELENPEHEQYQAFVELANMLQHAHQK